LNALYTITQILELILAVSDDFLQAALSWDPFLLIGDSGYFMLLS
jgi:hypothetical protein